MKSSVTATRPHHFIPTELNQVELHYQLDAATLTEQTLLRGQGVQSSTGALCIQTGEFTGRSPQDKYTVKDGITAGQVNWSSSFNIPLEEKYFLQLREKLLAYLGSQPEVWVRDAYACADETHRLPLRVITEHPWSSLFAHNMFLRPEPQDLETFVPEWQVIQAPGFRANPAEDGTRQHNFSIISFTHKTILIGGTGYTGEIKKGIFTVLNFLLPVQQQVLSMHCSANKGTAGDVAIFFGLSGTGKTTLSADPARQLIGDDEHGWTNENIFNFEGGCYAKLIDLSREKEPEIYAAIRPGALVENVLFTDDTNEIDFASRKITENTRVSYPLEFISNAVIPSVAGLPKHIFFLTCDAYGVLPPISRLTPEQAMYQFISGYTAKVAGTEAGVTEPKPTFSACFGAPFLPLHPGYYAEMLGTKLREQEVTVWLVNTGWSGGRYGTGQRLQLKYTRAMITAALNGKLEKVGYEQDDVFGLRMPVACEGVPAEILNPRNTWQDKAAYDNEARRLAGLFLQNFEQYENQVSAEIRAAAPQL